VKHVIVRAQTALFLYRYLSRLEPRGPASAQAFAIVLTDLRRGFSDAGIDPDGASDGAPQSAQ